MANTLSAPTLNRTLWQRGIRAPFRAFLRTETSSASVLVAAVVAALIWTNADAHSYSQWWDTNLAVRFGNYGITRDLRTWVNSGLMTFFFLVVGLEARREFDLGDLRERKRFVLPLAAGLTGMLIPVLIYMAFNHGGPGRHGWGIAMSTDTALALGLLSIVGRHVPDRVRVFLLTVFVVDDFVALIVIAFVYTDKVMFEPLVVAALAFAVFAGVLMIRNRIHDLQARAILFVLGFVMWVALLQSGVDPVVAGLLLGLLATAYSPAREELEQATGLFRLFREQPTAELAKEARTGLSATLSPNARLQTVYLPWTSYLIVPLFGLANAGISLNGHNLSSAFSSRITLGIVFGYVIGKPIAVVGASFVVTKITKGRLRPPVGWAGVLGSGTLAGIGFTVSFLIATLAFQGEQLNQAKIGVLSSAVLASLVTWVVYQLTDRLAPAPKARALLGRSLQIIDLNEPVDQQRDHVRGPENASVTLVEYGDHQCPYCGQAEPAINQLLGEDADIRYVWRQLPLTDVHPDAQRAAEASEAAAAQGKFWEMHDVMMHHQDNLKPMELVDYAKQLGLDTERFADDIHRHVFEALVAQDVESADLSGVSGTPTFFINGQRHYGAYDIETLTAAVETARARALIS